MLLVWSVAWTIFAANPIATYTAERVIERTHAEQVDIAARIKASKAASAALIAPRRL